MFRPARSVLRWLLWLVIALLPLRGWALAEMTAMTAMPRAAAEALPPCHAAPADRSMPPDADPQAAPHHAGCSLCEICHASLGLPAPPSLSLPRLPQAAPALVPVTGAADAPPDALFRPPRCRT
ncbi:MAG: hypothetical protein RL654_3142 [Pseudomonadota bacterium]|jgi:hypothetical protein